MDRANTEKYQTVIEGTAALVIGYGVPVYIACSDLQQALVNAALVLERGNRSRAARRLGLHRNSVMRWIRKANAKTTAGKLP